MFQLLNPLIDDLNAALAAHGLRIVMIAPPTMSIPATHSEHSASYPNPHSDAAQNDFAAIPKDYPERPEEGGKPPLNPDIERKKNRLSALMSRR